MRTQNNKTCCFRWIFECCLPFRMESILDIAVLEVTEFTFEGENKVSIKQDFLFNCLAVKKQSMKGGPWMENHGWIMKVPHTPWRTSEMCRQITPFHSADDSWYLDEEFLALWGYRSLTYGMEVVSYMKMRYWNDSGLSNFDLGRRSRIIFGCFGVEVVLLQEMELGNVDKQHCDDCDSG